MRRQTMLSKEDKKNIRDIAKYAGVTVEYLQKIIRNIRVPHLKTAVELERLEGLGSKTSEPKFFSLLKYYPREIEYILRHQDSYKINNKPLKPQPTTIK